MTGRQADLSAGEASAAGSERARGAAGAMSGACPAAEQCWTGANSGIIALLVVALAGLVALWVKLERKKAAFEAENEEKVFVDRQAGRLR